MATSITHRPVANHRHPRWRIRVEFKKEDAWVGVFWRTEKNPRGLLTTWWVCLVPMVPIVINRVRERRWCYGCFQHVPEGQGEAHGGAGWVHFDCAEKARL